MSATKRTSTRTSTTSRYTKAPEKAAAIAGVSTFTWKQKRKGSSKT